MRHVLLDHGFARRMMAGQLPDMIRLRPKNSAFSPDHYQRLQWQAAGKRARLNARGADDVFDAVRVQLSAMAAEYLLWWREGEVG